jgi:predicted ATPase/transcriptional regulator with XRE-family HTH domain
MNNPVVLPYKRKKQPGASELLKLYRHRSGLTQRGLAALLGLQSDRMVRKWESNHSLPEVKRLQKLIEVYLGLGMFYQGQELVEAQELWGVVKAAFENQSINFETFHIFDQGWFAELLRQIGPVKPGPIPYTLNFPGGPSPGYSRSHNLAVPVDSFIGRQKEAEQVNLYLAATPLLTITGPGGVGKTRLALEVARDLIDKFKEGVWQVDLAAPTPASVSLLSTLAALLEFKDTVAEADLVNYLKPLELLLLLNNCEHRLPECARLVNRLIQNCPRLKIIITSRESLGIQGETLFQLKPLPGVVLESSTHREREDPPDSSNPQVQLFSDRARAIRQDFSLTGQFTPLIDRICVRLDGLPLAIELAATRMEVLSLEQLEARLSDPFRLLKKTNPTALTHHQSLEACFDWSYQSLTVKEQVFFKFLCKLDEKWTLEEIEAAGREQALDEIEALDLLERLVKKSLVMVTPSGEQITYSLLETVRQYGQKLEGN